jgi:elongation factor G
MLLMHANDREDIQVAYAGDIVALAGLKDTTTGDTLCAPTRRSSSSGWSSRTPVIEVAVEPKTKADQEKMGVALNRLAREDPSFRVRPTTSGQTIIKGMGELHLEILVDRMKREFKVEANVGAPQVAYREISREAGRARLHPQEAVGRLRPVRRGQGHGVEPGERGSGFIFVDEVKGGNVPKEYIPSVEKGMRESPRPASLIGFPIIDFEATLYRRRLPRRRLVGAGVRDHRPRRDARSGPEGRHQAARADHEGRGRDARGLSRRRHRRPEQPARPDPGHRQPRQRPGRRGDGPACQHVRLR